MMRSYDSICYATAQDAADMWAGSTYPKTNPDGTSVILTGLTQNADESFNYTLATTNNGATTTSSSVVAFYPCVDSAPYADLAALFAAGFIPPLLLAVYCFPISKILKSITSFVGVSDK